MSAVVAGSLRRRWVDASTSRQLQRLDTVSTGNFDRRRTNSGATSNFKGLGAVVAGDLDCYSAAILRRYLHGFYAFAGSHGLRPWMTTLDPSHLDGRAMRPFTCNLNRRRLHAIPTCQLDGRRPDSVFGRDLHGPDALGSG